MTSSKELLYEIHNWLGRILLKPSRYQHTRPETGGLTDLVSGVRPGHRPVVRRQTNGQYTGPSQHSDILALARRQRREIFGWLFILLFFIFLLMYDYLSDNRRIGHWKLCNVSTSNLRRLYPDSWVSHWFSPTGVSPKHSFKHFFSF